MQTWPDDACLSPGKIGRANRKPCGTAQSIAEVANAPGRAMNPG